jgi:hypothetical protein
LTWLLVCECKYIVGETKLRYLGMFQLKVGLMYE